MFTFHFSFCSSDWIVSIILPSSSRILLPTQSAVELLSCIFFSFQLLYLSAPEFPWFFLKILFIDVLLLSIHCFPVFLYLLNLFKTVSLKVLLRKCMSGLPQAFCIFFPLHEPYFLVSLYAFWFFLLTTGYLNIPEFWNSDSPPSPEFAVLNC